MKLSPLYKRIPFPFIIMLLQYIIFGFWLPIFILSATKAEMYVMGTQISLIFFLILK